MPKFKERKHKEKFYFFYDVIVALSKRVLLNKYKLNKICDIKENINANNHLKYLNHKLYQMYANKIQETKYKSNEIIAYEHICEFYLRIKHKLNRRANAFCPYKSTKQEIIEKI